MIDVSRSTTTHLHIGPRVARWTPNQSQTPVKYIHAEHSNSTVCMQKHLLHCSDVIADLKNVYDEEASEGVMSRKACRFWTSEQHPRRASPIVCSFHAIPHQIPDSSIHVHHGLLRIGGTHKRRVAAYLNTSVQYLSTAAIRKCHQIRQEIQSCLWVVEI